MGVISEWGSNLHFSHSHTTRFALFHFRRNQSAWLAFVKSVRVSLSFPVVSTMKGMTPFVVLEQIRIPVHAGHIEQYSLFIVHVDFEKFAGA